MKYKPYPKYKDSGIQWIGEIPEEWEIDIFKHFYNSNMGQTIITLDLIANGKYPVLSATEKDNYFGTIDNPQFILNEGDFVIPARGNSIGFVTLVKEKCVSTQTTIYAKKIKKEIDSKFVYYFLKYHKNNLFPFTATAIPQITVSEVKENPLIVPPLLDQTAIANFLDKKTAEIDALIEKDKKLIALLKEKRTALINHTVTKGLDPNVKMKDSGIEWIGEIPEGWEVNKIKRKYHVIDGDRGKEYPSEDDLKDFGIPFLSAECIDDFKLFIDRSNYISEEKFHKLGRGKLKNKDIILTVRGTIGKAAVFFANKYQTGFINAEMMILRKYDDLKFDYLFYIISSDVWQKQVYYYSYGTAQKQLNNSILKNILIPVPSLKEQLQIVQYLDKATAKIDKTIQKIEQKIKLLKEYKKSLIHHVATGKVDVREVEA
jgi:type I restriction enzyme S subunit